jgi:cellulose synthase/poly-beta-1,6-N-acetylglucosamine synthase-like glycosyltransferase
MELPVGVVIATVAVVFGCIWMTVNAYNLVPLARLWVSEGWSWGQALYVAHEYEGDPREAPSIDVLLPAYREDSVIRSAITSIRAADYPQHKLHVVVLVEPDDDATKDELRRLASEHSFGQVDTPGGFFTMLEVPERYPGAKNKPRALNFGFQETYSDIVGVIDAEDVVDADLFSLIAGAIDEAGYDVVQGRLDMANEDDGWLNTLFRGEYGYWYRILLPALYHANYPVPLGGTTNFCSRAALEEISEIRKERFGSRWEPFEDLWYANLGETGPIPWDPLNVTEDFELGLLFWLEDYDVGLLDVDTREESPTRLNDWIKQRTRWQKGKVFTMIQFVRQPPDGVRNRFHVLFQSLLPHLGPINLFGVVLISIWAVVIDFRFSPVVFAILLLGLVVTCQYMLLQAIGYWVTSDAPVRRRVIRAVISAGSLLGYWVLLWGADMRALKQVYSGSTVWEKTTHYGKHLGREE